MSEVVDFEVPWHLIYHYYISGSIAIFLNLLVIYLILFHSGKLDGFRFYLLAFQIWCTASDVNIAFLTQPIPLFPVFAGYGVGFLYDWFDCSSFTLFVSFTFLLSGQIEVLTICFFRKHQAIMKLKQSTDRLPYPFIYVLCMSYSVAISTACHLIRISKEEQWQLIQLNHSSLIPQFQRLREFSLGYLNYGLIAFFVLTAFGTFKTTIVISVLVYRMYNVLSMVQGQLSKTTLARHRVALWSLSMQFMTTPISFLPAFIVLVVTLFPTAYSQEICRCSLMVATTHSTVNSLVVITTYPEFRKTFMFWKKPRKLHRISSLRPSGL
ncbi:Serpentine Receptor, class I [Caenorhabditis elegans]|uniref:Serpentine Receptor, class I n=1 Tax=Caenorhabditis elegans TaxID=6239 RepID=Q95X80_CAEEL|nr:Serpentine Receptor, class I [Caenorhabditis elegans]CCD61975.1 Serpentine Receptor, class I [Caenorhabditis elegans]|eukprot:NP_494432.1 Serpentine Receptor, class I [Caenorhabditis elegans]